MKKNKTQKTTNRKRTQSTRKTIAGLRSTDVTVGRNRYRQTELSRGNLTFTLQYPTSTKARKPACLTILDRVSGIETTVAGRSLTSLQSVLAGA